MAGNIIPAIATTNAIIAGIIVMQGMLVLQGQMDKCTTVYLNRYVCTIFQKKIAPPYVKVHLLIKIIQFDCSDDD